MPRPIAPRGFVRQARQASCRGVGALLIALAAVAPVVRAAAASPRDEDAGELTALPPPLGPSIDLASSARLVGAASWPSACSFRHPLCVHPSPGTPDGVATAVLASLERAWESIVGVLGAPPPDAGPANRWNVYLVEGVDDGAAVLAEGRDPVARFDRASSYALLDRGIRPGCELDLATARAVAAGALWRAAPSTDAGSASAQTEMLARLAVPCATGESEIIEFQSHPERALVDSSSKRFSRGAALFFDWLDRRFGAEPAALVMGMWALAPTQTPPDATNWARGTTGFDVLRVSLKGALWERSTLEDVFVRFAIARGMTVPSPRVAWHLPWPRHPRRIAAPEPVSPTGASYVLIDHEGAQPGARLRLEMEWEDFARFRWTVVKLDGAGRSLGELSVTSFDHATRAATTVESLDGVDGVMVVGVGLPPGPGPFDPGQGEWEAHGWLLTVESE